MTVNYLKDNLYWTEAIGLPAPAYLNRITQSGTYGGHITVLAISIGF